MPKKRNLSESSNESKSSASGSSSSGENDKVAKKAKKSEKSSKKNNEWALSKNRIVSITEFKNKHYLAIREYYADANGDMKPSKRGINLTFEQWSKLKEFTNEIDEAIKNV